MRFVAVLCLSLLLSGCGGFGAMMAAGMLGTVLGNLGSDTIEGKWQPKGLLPTQDAPKKEGPQSE